MGEKEGGGGVLVGGCFDISSECVVLCCVVLSRVVC